MQECPDISLYETCMLVELFFLTHDFSSLRDSKYEAAVALTVLIRMEKYVGYSISLLAPAVSHAVLLN